jgi:hypothetical protein
LLIATAACSGDHPAGPVAPTCSSALASQLTLAVGAYVSIDPATNGGCVTFPANASVDSDEYVLVPQSAAGTFNQSSPFQLRTATLAATAMPAAPRGTAGSSRATAVQFDGMLRALGRARSSAAAAALRAARAAGALRPLATPPVVGSVRGFAVCSALDCTTFKNVGARARIVGQHVAIYVDTLAPGGGLDSAHMDTLKQVFDTLLYPLDTTAFGSVSDLDGNGVVIALMTPVVNSLVPKTSCSSGFIAGFFFPNDLNLSAPTSQSNHGEIFYSIVADPNGTLSCAHTSGEVDSLTPGTFVHEFQHMINFAAQVRLGGPGEEGWLDEGLSKYAEELAGEKYLNLTPPDRGTFSLYAFNDVDDAYKYLSATGASPLLIEFDQGTLAEVGASWLFTRYLVDQFGDSLPKKLAQTSLVGSANVAAQTGHRFDSTLTHWALANWVSDSVAPGFVTPPELRYTTWHFRSRTFLSLYQQDSSRYPHPYPLVPPVSAGSAVQLNGTLRSGSGMYWRAIQAPGAPAFTLLFSGSGGAALPAAVVPRLSVIRIR